MTTSWRGTTIFVGVATLLGAAAAARFAAAEPPAGAAGTVPGVVTSAPGAITSEGGTASRAGRSHGHGSEAPTGATSVPSPSPKPSGNGTTTVVGSVVQTPYGPVQVAVTFQGSRVSGAQALQLPQGGRSDRISGSAAPILAHELVAAQSARIDAVSGATYTSSAYQTSVQYAIDHR